VLEAELHHLTGHDRLSCGTQEGGRTLKLAGQTAELYMSKSLYNVYKSRVQPR